MPTTLADWLAHAEKAHAVSMELTRDKVNFTLERVRAVKDRMGLRFDCPVISVAGTLNQWPNWPSGSSVA
jgi:dihydrofolate synthase/folylpolyglutamate synthase